MKKFNICLVRSRLQCMYLSVTRHMAWIWTEITGMPWMHPNSEGLGYICPNLDVYSIISIPELFSLGYPSYWG